MGICASPASESEYPVHIWKIISLDDGTSIRMAYWAINVLLVAMCMPSGHPPWNPGRFWLGAGWLWTRAPWPLVQCDPENRPIALAVYSTLISLQYKCYNATRVSVHCTRFQHAFYINCFLVFFFSELPDFRPSACNIKVSFQKRSISTCHHLLF